MPYSATNAEKSINYSIEHHCPQCGAPLFLDEADCFFICAYCRVRACISQKGFGRYYLAPHRDIPKATQLIFLPYWRFKGIQYECTLNGVDHWFTDTSWLAVKVGPGPLPFSLGTRSQALTLKRVSARTPGKFIRPLPFEDGLKPGKGRARYQGPVIKEDIGETTSLIYAPFFMDRETIFDGILNTPLGRLNQNLETMALCRPEKETRILSGICPECGWDLEGRSDSLILTCKNCHTLWQPKQDRLGKIRYKVAGPRSTKDQLIPFWKISARVQGLSLNGFQDLISLGNLAKGEASSKSDPNDFHFWIPAFKIRPKVFLRIGRHLTIAQPAPDFETKIGPHLPVTLNFTEAVQSIKIVLASLARPLKDHLPLLAAAKVKPESAALIFLPFESHAHEFIHPKLNLALNKNMLKQSGNL
ncbi:MAG: hypothetical protein HUK40_12865 [Desulfobacter sp.]|nr:hypothetical protein [Desulfobacter sp.]